MSYLIEADNELSGLRKLLQLILEKGQTNDRYLEILGCLLTIHYDPAGLACFHAFHGRFLNIAGDLGRKGWNRATRVYTTMQDLPSKPSYLKRLTEYPDRPRKADQSVCHIDQLSTISSELAQKPGFSTLSFVFLRPADLIDKFRPGYVPCPIAGDFKFRDEKLHLTVFFRTCDAFAVGYADIYYLRNFQHRVLNKAKEISSSERIARGEMGDLHLYFSRAYVQKHYQTKSSETRERRSVSVIPLVLKLIEELGNVTSSTFT
jgi:thymidylate synthase